MRSYRTRLTRPIGISYISGMARGDAAARYGSGWAPSAGMCAWVSVTHEKKIKAESGEYVSVRGQGGMGVDGRKARTLMIARKKRGYAPVIVHMSAKVGVLYSAIAQYVKYVRRMRTTEYAGRRIAHSLCV